MTQLFFASLREDPVEAEIASHRLMVRAGLIRKVAAGIYAFLPLGQRAVAKVARIVREEMDRAGAQEVGLPIVQPAELWLKSGRWFKYGPEMWKLKDRHEREYALGPTHEEIITTLADAEISSWRQLPVNLYQMQNKYRDEIRPRFGLMRSREFIMKDAYSFDRDQAGMEASYRAMDRAYTRIFTRCGFRFRPVESDSGAIGGDINQEFMALADTGEAALVVCQACGYAANVERAEGVPVLPSEEAARPLERVHTPGIRTIEELVAHQGLPVEHTSKILFYDAALPDPEQGERHELVAALVRGDRQLNEVKLRNAVGALTVQMASQEAVRERTGAPFGSAGPVNLAGGVRLLADREVAQGQNFAVGANEADWHYLNANLGRDFTVDDVTDLRVVEAGDPCPNCGQPLTGTRGIEVGQIFQLGTVYSEALDARYTAEDGSRRPFWMGCYGIGVTRTVAAAVEQLHDDNGICWPVSIAPFHVEVVPLNMQDDAQAQTAADIHRGLQEAGLDVLLDDRDERAGVKFNDADLIGLPFRITVGGRGLKEGVVELVQRADGATERLPLAEAVATTAERVRAALAEIQRTADEAAPSPEAE